MSNTIKLKASYDFSIQSADTIEWYPQMGFKDANTARKFMFNVSHSKK